jgi:hypothetical protein
VADLKLNYVRLTQTQQKWGNMIRGRWIAAFTATWNIDSPVYAILVDLTIL